MKKNKILLSNFPNDASFPISAVSCNLLAELGWNKALEEAFTPYAEKKCIPARICQEMKNRYGIWMETGEDVATVSQKLFDSAFNRSDLPAIGDWVAVERKKPIDPYRIVGILPRKSCFSRKAKNTYGRNFTKAGSSDEQILSVNVDIVFIVISLNFDYNLRKIERYLSLIWESDVKAVILLNKIDLCDDFEQMVEEVKSISNDVPVHAISALQGDNMNFLRDYLSVGTTISLIGSSGVGKSTIINALLGEEKQLTAESRAADGRGRHTTSHRELIILPSGGILIDNPGLRDIKIIGTEVSLNKTFEDIKTLAAQCRFRNCHHDSEPDCAVREAIENGELDEKRLDSFLKLQDELGALTIRRKQRIKKEERLRSDLIKFGFNKRPQH